MSSSNNTTRSINFSILNVFVKDISFEAPHTPQIFSAPWLPRTSLDFQMTRAVLEKDIYELVLKVSIAVNIVEREEDLNNPDAKSNVAFIVEVEQAGVFEISNVADDKELDFILGTTAPTVLFPYARETITTLVAKGGFPQLVLSPVNFETMYRQHVAEKAYSERTEDTVIQ